MKWVLLMVLAISPLEASADCQTKEKAGQGAIALVQEFANADDPARSEVQDLTATAVTQTDLPGVTLYRVTLGSTQKQEDGSWTIHGISDGPEWLVAEGLCGKYFKLAGFGRETEFDSLMRYLAWNIDSSEKAVQQINLWFKYANSRPPIVVSDTRTFAQAAARYWPFTRQDPETSADVWIAHLPAELEKAVGPPVATVKPYGFLVECYGIEALRSRLALVKFWMRVTSDGNVVQAHRVDMYTSPPPAERIGP
jgi:hypothetical protein